MFGLGRLFWSIEDTLTQFDGLPARVSGTKKFEANLHKTINLNDYYDMRAAQAMRRIRRSISPASLQTTGAAGLTGLVLGGFFAGPIGGLAGLVAGTYVGSQKKTGIKYRGAGNFVITSSSPAEKIKYYAKLTYKNKFGLPFIDFGLKYLTQVIAPKVSYYTKLAASKIPKYGIAAPTPPAIAAPALPAIIKPARPDSYRRRISMAYDGDLNEIIVRYKTIDPVPKSIIERDTYRIHAGLASSERIDGVKAWFVAHAPSVFDRPAST